MTVATNALLEGRTARTALIATAGFTDVIELGRQARAHLYELCRSGPASARARRAALRGARAHRPRRPAARARSRPRPRARAGARPRPPGGGRGGAAALLRPSLPRAPSRRADRRAAARHPTSRSPAIWSAPSASTSERPRPFSTRPSRPCSAPTCAGCPPRPRAGGLPEPLIMQSSGGLTDSERAAAHAALTVLSGPAGGVGGALLLAELAGEPNVLCFDMGGTSCDVCLIDGSQVAETAERAVAGRPLALPALDIHTVGAGGGSIAWRDPGGALRVGPASAGAVPGPACYGARRPRADRHRRQPAARPPARGLAPRRRASRSTARRPSAPSPTSRASSTWMCSRARRGSSAWPRRRCWAPCA